MLEQLTSSHELHDEENLLWSLERVDQVDQERVVDVLQDHLFRLGVLNLVLVDDLLLAERLKGVNLLCVLLLDKHHLSEGSSTQDLQKVEVINGDILTLIRKLFIDKQKFERKIVYYSKLHRNAIYNIIYNI